MMKLIFAFTFIILMISCNDQFSKLSSIEDVKPPPGTIQLDKNFFVDDTELANVHYREFEYYVENKFGGESEELSLTNPDMNIWEGYSDSFPEAESYYYFGHPKYNSYPIVGISYEQANAFARWRTDRVFQMMLIEKDAINPPTTEVILTPGQRFTVSDYFEKKVTVLKYDSTVLIPYYSLPSLQDWNKIISIIQDEAINKASFNTLRNRNMETTYPVTTTLSNEYGKSGLYNIMGNVAEMTAQRRVAVGGSWNHTFPDSLFKTYRYSKPEPWLGVRYICKYISYDEYKELERDRSSILNR